MKNKQYIKIFLIFTILFLSNFSLVLSGQQSVDSGGGSIANLDINIPNPLKGGAKSIPEIVTLVLDSIVIPLGSVVIVLAIIYSGWKFIMAQGNSADIQKQKENLKWVVVGSAIILGAKAISLAINSTISQISIFK